MSDIVVASVRDAVVTAINGAALTPAIQAVAIYDIVFNLQQLKGGRMVVVPRTKEDELLSRGAALSEVGIDVAIQYKYSSPLPTELDPYLALSEVIAASQTDGGLFLGKQLLGTNFWCLETKYPHGLFLEKHIEDFRAFTSVVSLTFSQRQ